MRQSLARLSAAITTRTPLAVLSAAAFVLALAAVLPKMHYG